jgi:hypothetical protein
MTIVVVGNERTEASDGASPEEKSCKKKACAIQLCLAQRNYKEHLCQPYIDDWNRCLEETRAARKVHNAADTTTA